MIRECAKTSLPRGPAAAPVSRPSLIRRLVAGSLDRAVDAAAALELRGYAGTAPGREGDEEITLFDSTGLAIQDLAVARAAYARAGELDLPHVEL